jgi:hypothetical protein
VASVVAARVLKSIRLGLVAGLFFPFHAGLPFLIELGRSLSLTWLKPATALAQDELQDYMQAISPDAHVAYPRFMSHPHQLIGLAILLSCIVMATQLGSRRSRKDEAARWYQWLGLGVLFGSIALVEVTIFALGLAGWGLFVLWQALKERNIHCIRDFALAAAPATLIGAIQGGVLTTTLFQSSPADQGLESAFKLHVPPLPLLLGEFALQSAYPMPWLGVYILYLGLPFIAIPALLIWVFRSKFSTPLAWLIAMGAIGIVVPHFVTHQYSSNLLRWTQYSASFLSLMLGISLAALLMRSARRHWALLFVITCTGLTIGWPIAVSIENRNVEKQFALGMAIEDQWTLSPPLRQSHHIDPLSGRSYPFRMGGEARQFLRSLPPTARVLTNQFPEVPLLIRGLAPHKNTDVFSYTNFQFLSSTYFDALYALDPSAMQQYGITHIVVNLKWYQNSDPQAQAILQDRRHFSLVFSDERSHEGYAWHHVYEVLPAFYEESPQTSLDLVRNLPELVPKGASVYISPAIPADIRWALSYMLRERPISSAPIEGNHTKVRLVVEEPQPTDNYDFALLIDEPAGERWLNWPFTSQDIPSAWGLHQTQRIWNALGVGLYAVNRTECPMRTLGSVPAALPLPANVLTEVDINCLETVRGDEEATSSSLLTLISEHASRVEIVTNDGSHVIEVEPGATQVPIDLLDSQTVSLIPSESMWFRIQGVPDFEPDNPPGIPVLHVEPTLEDGWLKVNARVYGYRIDPSEDQLFWEIYKQRRTYGHWWHWSSASRVRLWQLSLAEPPNGGSSYYFNLDLAALDATLSVDGRGVEAQTQGLLPQNPGEPYVLYLTLYQQAARVQTIPVAWFTYGPDREPTALLAPRLILLDQDSNQE